MITKMGVQMILFAQTLFGSWFVIRTLQVFHARSLVKSSVIKKVGTFFVFIVLSSGFLCAFDAFLSAICIFATLITNFLLLFTLERRQIDTLKSEFSPFLDRWILNLKLGLAAAHARELALSMHSDGFRSLVHPVFAFETSMNSIQKHVLLSSSVVQELRKISTESHLCLSRLEVMRSNVRKLENFRRKSGHAVRQTRTQAVVMMIMLVALTIFTLLRYGVRPMADLILCAILTSSLGVLIMLTLARKTKWKV